MKSTYALGILLILSASACAPVASSGPKFAQSATPQIHDSVVKSSPERKSEPKIVSKVRVVSVDEIEAVEKSLDTDYVLQRFDEKDAHVAEFRRTRSMKEVALGEGLHRAEVLVIFVVKTKPSRAAKLKLESRRDAQNALSFSAQADEDSAAEWAAVQEGLNSIVIASREANTK